MKETLNYFLVSSRFLLFVIESYSHFLFNKILIMYLIIELFFSEIRRCIQHQGLFVFLDLALFQNLIQLLFAQGLNAT